MHPSNPLSWKAVCGGAKMVLGIGEGVPQPIPGRAGPPRGWGVGTVWPGKESLVGPRPWLALGRPGAQASPCTFGLVGIQARPDPWSIPGSARLPGRAEVGAEILARHRAGPALVFVQAQRPGASAFPGDPSTAAGVCRPSQSRRRGRTDSDQERRPRRGPCPARAWRSKPSAQASSDALRPGPSDSFFPCGPGSAGWRLVLCFQASAWALSCTRQTPISTR